MSIKVWILGLAAAGLCEGDECKDAKTWPGVGDGIDGSTNFTWG